MSSKSRKSGSQTPLLLSSPAASSTQYPPQMRPSSPLSPTRQSRLKEKVDLQNLNDRLACYIDRVRHLETENSRLTLEIQTSRETVTRETSNIKLMYERELSDARKLLDETAREKAKLEIDTKRLWEENDDLKKRLDKKTKDLLLAENSARIFESRCSELNGKYSTACSERKKALDDNKDLEKEILLLRKQLEDARKHLEEETLARVDLENNVQSLREELTFNDQIFQQELTETRTKRQVDISEIDGRLAEQYEVKLQQSLQELRDQYETQMRQNRDEIETIYENKVRSLQMSAQRQNNSSSAIMEELRQSRTRIDGLNNRINELEAGNTHLSARIRDLEKLLEVESIRHREEVLILENELQRMRDEMAQQLQEYQDLMDIKVSLDLEIAAYDKMLKGEEYRLNLTPGNQATVSQQSLSFHSSHGTPLRRTPSRASGNKRKRTIVEESEDRNSSDYSITSSAKSDIEIIETDSEGKYVKLHNKSNKEHILSGWQLVRTAGGNETQFKFHRTAKIDGNGYITVWSADLGVIHEPPTNIVMKSQKWFVGDQMKTVLLNNEGEELAVSERIRRILSSHASRHRELGGYGEELFHHQVRPGSVSARGDPQGEEKCRIM